jgi:hypothetical protein
MPSASPGFCYLPYLEVPTLSMLLARWLFQYHKSQWE